MKLREVLLEITTACYKMNKDTSNMKVFWHESDGFTIVLLDGCRMYRIPTEKLPFNFKGESDTRVLTAWNAMNNYNYFPAFDSRTAKDYSDRTIRIFDERIAVNEKFLKHFDKNCEVLITVDEKNRPIIVKDSDGICGFICPIHPDAWKGIA